MYFKDKLYFVKELQSFLHDFTRDMAVHEMCEWKYLIFFLSYYS